MLWFGIDPSLVCTGWGLIQLDGSQLRHVDHGVVRTKPTMPIQDRLWYLRTCIETVMGRLDKNDGIAMEETTFVGKGLKSAAQLHRVQGAILSLTPNYVARVEIMGVSQWRKALGIGGNADKEAATAAVTALLGMSTPPTPHAAAEALGIAIAGSTR